MDIHQCHKMKVAIIGCGTIATTHAKAIEKCDRAELVYCCDVVSDRAEKLSSRYGGKPISSYQEVLEDDQIEAVHILTPHYLHYPMTVQALNHGKNVVLEKPAAMELEHLNHLIELEEATGSKVAVVFQNRLNPSTVRMKDEIEQGRIGEIKGIKAFVTWHRNDEYYNNTPWRSTWEHSGGGHLINQGIHTVDLMQYFGGDIEAVQGMIANRNHQGVIEVEDTAEIMVEFKNGIKGLYYGTNNHCVDSKVLLEVVGEKGTLRITEGQLWLVQDGEAEVLQKDFISKGSKGYWGNSHTAFINKVYEQFEKQLPVETSLRDALPSLFILSELYRDHETNQQL